jgi:hypothetical protein
MSRWSKKSQEEKERILRGQVTPGMWAAGPPFYARIKTECDKAKKAAGNEGKHCSACDLRCLGCPFESAWPKENKEGGKDV